MLFLLELISIDLIFNILILKVTAFQEFNGLGAVRKPEKGHFSGFSGNDLTKFRILK